MINLTFFLFRSTLFEIPHPGVCCVKPVQGADVGMLKLMLLYFSLNLYQTFMVGFVLHMISSPFVMPAVVLVVVVVVTGGWGAAWSRGVTTRSRADHSIVCSVAGGLVLR